jgi:hypothetical protein
MPHDVFISYVGGDRSAADAICAFLEARQIRCWQAPRDLPDDGDFAKATVDALTRSRAVVVLLSAASNSSRYVKREFGLASSRNIPIFPVRLDDSRPDEIFRYVPTGRAEIVAVDGLEAHLGELSEAIGRVLGTVPGAPKLQPTQPPGPVFISWCSPDEAAATGLVAELESAGLKCWVSNRDVSENYQREIAAAIKSARAMVLVFSSNVNDAPDRHGSDQILKEIGLADRYRLRVFPVRIEDCEPQGAFEFELNNRQYFDFFRNREANWRRLVAVLNGTIGAVRR